jgi:hypothetical protein
VQGFGPVLYALHRFHFGGLPVARYIVWFWLLIALIAGVAPFPGHWIIMTVAIVLWVAQIVLGLHFRRKSYISFTPTPQPALHDTPLEPSEKLSIYATGLLSVEGRYQRYCALPGFYRTFATGEHALLCRVQERTWLGMFSWPPEEIGMWYAFVKPADIQQLTWGTLHFGTNANPAIAIAYHLELPPSPRRKRAEIRQEILYIAAAEPRDAERLYLDLLNNLPASKIVTSLSTSK